LSNPLTDLGGPSIASGTGGRMQWNSVSAKLKMHEANYAYEINGYCDTFKGALNYLVANIQREAAFCTWRSRTTMQTVAGSSIQALHRSILGNAANVYS